MKDDYGGQGQKPAGHTSGRVRGASDNAKSQFVEIKEVIKRFNLDPQEVATVSSRFNFRVPRHFYELIKEKGDSIYLQCVPDVRELKTDDGVDDPLSEEAMRPVRCIVHRYPDRVLFLATLQCPMYCRFCTRKRTVGNGSIISAEALKDGIKYVREHGEIRDVLISGGDPLMLPFARLEWLLRQLSVIEHVEVLRIGTRVPCANPRRINPKLCNMLRKYHPLYVNIHFNHPDEVNAESAQACRMLADAGIPLGSQTVLLKGVNDSAETLKYLFRKLLRIRVKPYYLYQADLTCGTSYLRTTVQQGLQIMRQLRGYISGIAVPNYVIDAPGGGGKIPVQPNYIVEINEDKVVLRNYEGKKYIYQQSKCNGEPDSSGQELQKVATMNSFG